MKAGIDIVEIERVEKVYRRFGERFLERLLSPLEREIFERKKEPISFLAGRFAAKEAVRKVLAPSLPYRAIGILPDEEGKLTVLVQGCREELAVSLSHERKYAVAIALKESA